jgi:hypothetical protein
MMMTRLKKWLIVSAALIVAGMLLVADLSFAQPRGQGMGRGPQDGQGWMQGRGAGNPNCPYYLGYGQGPQGRGNKSQARQNRRWNRPVNAPASQVVVPPSAQ